MSFRVVVKLGAKVCQAPFSPNLVFAKFSFCRIPFSPKFSKNFSAMSINKDDVLACLYHLSVRTMNCCDSQ